jgi:hypothetical protein
MHIIHRFYLSLIFIFLFNSGILNGQIIRVPFRQLSLEECLLPTDHPLQAQLAFLFHNSKMFKSREKLRQAGFKVLKRMHRGLMVAGHPFLGSYLIKKFVNSIPQNHQLDNFIKRVSGARALRRFIELNGLQHIVVPQKWIYRLPKQFTDPESHQRSYILIVEKMDLCSSGKNPKRQIAQRYHTMDLDILRELCIVVYYFRGLDSTLENMPFTRQNKIAFIDTEKWALAREEPFLHQAMLHLSADRQRYASQIFEMLNQIDPRH